MVIKLNNLPINVSILNLIATTIGGNVRLVNTKAKSDSKLSQFVL